MIARKYYFSNN